MSGVSAVRQASVREPEQLECTLADLVERARDLASGGTRKVLGIAGAPGAGKSTVARAIAAALDGRAVEVGMDAFHLAHRLLADHGSLDRKGAPDTFDAWGYANLLRRLKGNRDPVVYAPVFDRSLEEPVGSAIAVPQDVPLVITEGNYLLLDAPGWSEARRLIDEVWYLDADDGERRLRLVRRHEAFGKSSEDAASWASGSDQRNADVVSATRDRADLIITLSPPAPPTTFPKPE